MFFPAVIEHVRDGCTVRAFLLPNFDYVTVMLAGIKVGLCIYFSDLTSIIKENLRLN